MGLKGSYHQPLGWGTTNTLPICRETILHLAMHSKNEIVDNKILDGYIVTIL